MASMGQDLLAVIEEAKEWAREEAAERANPSQCPRCTGEIVENDRGQRICPFDGLPVR